MKKLTNFLLFSLITTFALLLSCQSTPPPPEENEITETEEENGSKSVSPMQGVVEVTGYIRLEQNNGQNFVLISDANFKYFLVLKNYEQVDKILSYVNKHVTIKGMLEILESRNGEKEFQLMTDVLQPAN